MYNNTIELLSGVSVAPQTSAVKGWPLAAKVHLNTRNGMRVKAQGRQLRMVSLNMTPSCNCLPGLSCPAQV